MTDKTFTVAGVSFHNGAFKVRFANGMSRVRVLEKNGHTEIELFEFEADTKVELVDKLLNVTFKNPAAREAVLEEAREYGFLV